MKKLLVLIIATCAVFALNSQPNSVGVEKAREAAARTRYQQAQEAFTALLNKLKPTQADRIALGHYLNATARGAMGAIRLSPTATEIFKFVRDTKESLRNNVSAQAFAQWAANAINTPIAR